MVYGGEFETGSGGINVESEMIGLCVTGQECALVIPPTKSE